MSILDIFRAQPAQVTNPDLQPKVGDGATLPGDKTLVSDGKGPAAFPAVPDPKDDKSPLAGFVDFWQTPEKKVGDKGPEPIVPSFNADPKQLLAAAGQIDFAKAVSPELMEAAIKGDASAFTKVLNTVAQLGYAQAAHASSKLTEAAMSRLADNFMTKVLPAELKKHSVNFALTEANPLFSNPAVAPMLEMFKSQAQVKYPNATAVEIQKLAQDYLTQFADAIKSGSPEAIAAAATKEAAGGIDWEKWATEGPAAS